MARTKAGVGPVQTAQVIFMIDPKVAGEVEAWRVKRGVTIKSTQYREIFLAGLEALRPAWEAEHGAPSTRAINKAVKAAPSGRAPKPAAGAPEVVERRESGDVVVQRAKPRKRATKTASKAA